MTTLDAVAVPLPAIERVVVVKHHWLVRLSHWANVVILTGLVMSGLSIYWASPVFQHAPAPHTGSRDYLADIGLRVGHSKTWIYDKFGLGTFALADALQLHWIFAYLFMLTGLLYLAGLVAGGGWRGLMPRRGQVTEAIRMQWYYAGVIPAKILRKPWTHPPVTTKYNALQRTAYASMPVAALLIIASGWAMHKPAQLYWLERLFGSYDGARIVHFATMCLFLAFVIPHVVLAAVDGWDTMRSMVVGWSDRVAPQVAYVAPAPPVITATPEPEVPAAVSPVAAPASPPALASAALASAAHESAAHKSAAPESAAPESASPESAEDAPAAVEPAPQVQPAVEQAMEADDDIAPGQ